MTLPPKFVNYFSDPNASRALQIGVAPNITGNPDIPQFVAGHNMTRMDVTNSTIAITSGVIYCFGPYVLSAGQGTQIVGINFGSTSAVTPTHSWAGIATTAANPVVLAVSPDATTSALTASTNKNYTFNARYNATQDIPIYAFFCAVAATMPTLAGSPPLATAAATITTPIAISGNTGQTAPPAVGATLATTATIFNSVPWFYIGT